MQIRRTTPKRKRLSLTSLIDVIFLLLLFFMLSSTFSKYAKIEINSGKGGSISVFQKPIIVIALGSDSIRINGKTLHVGTLQNSLVSLIADGRKKALITVSEKTTTQQLADLLQQLAIVDGLSVVVAR